MKILPYLKRAYLDERQFNSSHLMCFCLFMPDLTLSQVDTETPGQFAHYARALPMKWLLEITKVYHLPGNQSTF